MNENEYVTDEMQFDGDIIITDPCYLIRYENGITDNDWGYCQYGDKMRVLGLENSIVRDTLYGDWSCTMFDIETEEPVGEYCADAGLVGVFMLDEVLKYNPEFDYHIEKSWTTTWIKNCKGIAQFIEVADERKDEQGNKYMEMYVEVAIKGINKETGKPFNYRGKQTGY